MNATSLRSSTSLNPLSNVLMVIGLAVASRPSLLGPNFVGSMGRPLPGYDVALLDSEGREATEGELSLRLNPRPMGLMVGYLDDPARTAAVMADGYYRTGDEASRDEAGYYHYVGRGDGLHDGRQSTFFRENSHGNLLRGRPPGNPAEGVGWV